MSLLPTLLPFVILWRALKAVLDVCLDVLGEEVAGVALDGGAVLPNQELLKVPRDVCPPHWFPNQEVGAEKVGVGHIFFLQKKILPTWP